MDALILQKSVRAWKIAYSIAYVGVLFSVGFLAIAPTLERKALTGIAIVIVALLALGAHKKMSRACMTILLLLHIANLILTLIGLEEISGRPFILFLLILFMLKGTTAVFKLHKAGITSVKEIQRIQEQDPCVTKPSTEVNF